LYRLLQRGMLYRHGVEANRPASIRGASLRTQAFVIDAKQPDPLIPTDIFLNDYGMMPDRAIFEHPGVFHELNGRGRKMRAHSKKRQVKVAKNPFLLPLSEIDARSRMGPPEILEKQLLIQTRQLIPVGSRSGEGRPFRCLENVDKTGRGEEYLSGVTEEAPLLLGIAVDGRSNPQGNDCRASAQKGRKCNVVRSHYPSEQDEVSPRRTAGGNLLAGA